MAVLRYQLDSRMIHGQVSAFARNLNIEFFLVVNEDTANSETDVMLLELAALNTEVEVVSPEEAYDILSSGELDDYRTMVVFKYITDVKEMIDLGYRFDELSISGMYARDEEKKEKVETNLFVDAEDLKNFRYFEDNGVVLTHQIAPEYKKKFVKDIVKY